MKNYSLILLINIIDKLIWLGFTREEVMSYNFLVF